MSSPALLALLPTPALVWGLWPRLLALVYLCAFASMRRAALVFAGTRGLAPHAHTLAAQRRDYPGWRRWLYFPSLLWLASSDRALRRWLDLGLAAALVALYGGPLAPFALALCWLVLLSYDGPLDLAYPWESALFEAGLLALLLPAPLALPSLEASAAPLPAVAWAHRFLLFRVLFGFGKLRFLSSLRWDRGYLRSFLLGQPLPTPLGWRLAQAPAWLHRAGVALLFLVEVPLPFAIFATGTPRLVAALGVVGLMTAIQLCGNFGFFNLLMTSLAWTLLDHQSSLFEVTVEQLRAAPIAHAFVLLVAVGGLLHLPFVTWVSRSWLYWPSVTRPWPLPLRALLGLYRLLMPFRVVHAYGVFPPRLGPPARWVTALQGSRDGRTWYDYEFTHLPTTERTPLRFLAPFAPRLDHAMFYEALGVSPTSLYGSFFGLGTPYRYARPSPLERLAQRILEGETTVTAQLARNPFPDPRAPPRYVRARLRLLEAASPAERSASGGAVSWRTRDAGPHLSPTALDAHFWDDALPHPELFHWDERWWRARSPALAPLRSARAYAHPAGWRAALRAYGLADDAVARFWTELLPLLEGPVRHDWTHFEAVVAAVEARFSRPARRDLARVAGCCAELLAARLAPYYDGRAAPRLALPSWFHLGLFVRTLLLDGLAPFEEALQAPERAVARGNHTPPRMSEGLLLEGVLRPEALRLQARKARLLARTLGRDGQPPMPRGVPGFVALAPWFETQLVTDDDALLPRWERRPEGTWTRVASEASAPRATRDETSRSRG